MKTQREQRYSSCHMVHFECGSLYFVKGLDVVRARARGCNCVCCMGMGGWVPKQGSGPVLAGLGYIDPVANQDRGWEVGRIRDQYLPAFPIRSPISNALEAAVCHTSDSKWVLRCMSRAEMGTEMEDSMQGKDCNAALLSR